MVKKFKLTAKLIGYYPETRRVKFAWFSMICEARVKWSTFMQFLIKDNNNYNNYCVES